MCATRIASIIEERSSTYVDWLQQLCSIHGISAHNKGIQASVDAVTELIQKLGGTVQLLTAPGANPTVYAEFKGASDRALLFYNHYDVQPADPLDEWDVPPFLGVVRDGTFYARGAADNKGDLVSRLAAVDAWQRSGRPLPCTVKFIIEGEEEIGSPHLDATVEKHADLLRSDVCIWKYGSRDPGERLEMHVGQKGILYVELQATVATSDLHSGYGSLVEAASNRLVRALATLRDGRGQILIPGFYDAVVPPSHKTRATLEAIPFEDDVLRQRYGIQRFLRDRIRTGALAALVLEPTCTICGIESGYTGEGMRTVLPKQARAKVEFRLVPDQTPDNVAALLRHHLDMKDFRDIEVRVLAAEPPFQTPLDDPFVELAAAVAGQSTGRDVIVYPNSQYSGPMHAVNRALNVPIVSLGVGYWDRRAHAPNENIRLDDFFETIQLMAHLFQAVGDVQ